MSQLNSFPEKFLLNKGSNMQNQFGRVAVLLGGESRERAISIQSGEAIYQALIRMGIDAHIIDAGADLIEKLMGLEIEFVFIALHGGAGENGQIQAVLQQLKLPFTGSDFAACALAMDKVRSKYIFACQDIPTPPFKTVTNLVEAKAAAKLLGFPLCIKPVNEGSSLGVSRVDEMGEVASAFSMAKNLGNRVLVERWIEGKDLFVSVLGDKVLPPVLVQPAHAFYDYDAKYQSNQTQYTCPAPLSESQNKILQDISLRTFEALGASGWGRIDFVQDHDGQFWVLELNTVPGMTSHSLVPLSAKTAGIQFDELVLEIMHQALLAQTEMDVTPDYSRERNLG